MVEERILQLSIAILVCEIAYLVILFAERIQSLVRAGKERKLLHDGLHKYMTGLCFASMIGTILLVLIKFIYAKQFQLQIVDATAAELYWMRQSILTSIIITVALFSGMVHTEYSIPGLQFVSYGILIAAMIMEVIVQNVFKVPLSSALALAYVVAFSMAIPVVYPSNIEKKNVFHIVESIVSFVLVIAFGIMFWAILVGDYAVMLHPALLLVAVLGDALVLALRWKEEVNWFVLVSLALAVLLRIVCAIV